MGLTEEEKLKTLREIYIIFYKLFKEIRIVKTKNGGFTVYDASDLSNAIPNWMIIQMVQEYQRRVFKLLDIDTENIFNPKK